eukprot:TRINITY_DN9670_c0_g1_i1.p1 TRINITY_DN9670_c0_g1~~TRINITY_DN9670_c0_g1_i1.p1  ORF type:complete len:719 (+),score=324.47 TRINITY_DN9670_c0_g1_i1:136-2292(+)
MPPKVAADQKLPQKEENQFKQLAKLYEQKQFKKGLKLTEGILKKNPDHGETLAMRGLLLSNHDERKKAEAYDLVKTGLRKNMQSHVCWHVYGLLYRGDRDYNQAIRCYRNALRHDPDNLAILRDLSMLQVQMRDLKNLTETRQKLLELKPSAKNNWLGFALAHHLQGNLEVALALFDSYETTMGLNESKYETGELLLYRATLLLENKQFDTCLKLFQDQADKLTDQCAVDTMSAQCHMALGQNEEAERLYRKLIKATPENLKHLQGAAGCRGMQAQNFRDATDEERAKVLPLVQELRKEYPRSRTIQRAELDLLKGPDFKKAVAVFLRAYLEKTVPALPSAVKGFYLCQEKATLVGEVLQEFEKSLLETKRLPGVEEEATPLVLVWTWLALSCHHLRLKDLKKAHEFVDKAIGHTPTIDTLYIHRARILKHEGKLAEAAEAADVARKMDEADRYNNTKTTRLLLRADKWEEAERVINMFAFRTPDSQALANIVEMQIQWYELELADCYVRLGDVLSATKRYLLIDKHFTDFSEDFFDFHSYCLRKFVMRAYLDMLRNADTAKGHKFYCKAAQKLVRCYLELHKMGPEEAERRVLPELQKRQKEKPQTKEQQEKDKEIEMVVDMKQPLEAAVRFLESLQRFRGQEVLTHQLAAELHYARGKPLPVLQALKRASMLPGSDANEDLRKIAQQFFASPGNVGPVVSEIITEAMPDIKKRLKL